ncbi:hypothetical protein LK540_14835 [Massilia sp. IC2-278]|jgi:hypothetical protein|uniref:hypothetical protein n=1 Tax=Massilia sp. IC2-278 TaxID=2887200 RepID=UPI001E35EFD2|nr:hypothetical protein [Massilia sp. IC2-278]MCC2961704.1 hypothetical protein [Massilia sp. IC2-278]
MSFVFRLVREEGGAAPAVVFEDSTSPGFVPLWEEVGVYDALYNSDGKPAREVSRSIAYGLDRISEEAGLNRLLPSSLSMGEAIRFLENVNRGCVIHGTASIETR